MRQFLHVLRFEFTHYVRGKGFIGVTLALMLIVGVVLFFPRLSDAFSGGNDVTAASGPADVTVDGRSLAALAGAGVEEASDTRALFESLMPQYEYALSSGDVSSLTQAVTDGQYEIAIVMEGADGYTLIVGQLGMYDTTAEQVHEVMQARAHMLAMGELGVPAADARAVLLPAPLRGSVVQTGKDQFTSFLYTYVLIFGLYMAILLYGQFVASGVASEKSSRAMELLITSAKPVNLIFGKVFGAGLAGLAQLTVILGSSYAFYTANQSYWQSNTIVSAIFGMSVPILLYTILFFVLGFFLYAFLYGALGSLVSRMEELNTTVMPATFLFVIAFFVVIFSMTSGNVDSILMRVCSYIPFTAPMAMFTRVAMSEVPAWEIILSVSILIFSNLGIGYLAAGVYRMGVLLYGKKPKPGEILRALRRARA